MQSHYDRLGGEEVVRNVVNRFYDLMDEQPEFYGIRKLHPQDISGSRQKLFILKTAIHRRGRRGRRGKARPDRLICVTR